MSQRWLDRGHRLHKNHFQEFLGHSSEVLFLLSFQSGAPRDTQHRLSPLQVKSVCPNNQKSKFFPSAGPVGLHPSGWVLTKNRSPQLS